MIGVGRIDVFYINVYVFWWFWVGLDLVVSGVVFLCKEYGWFWVFEVVFFKFNLIFWVVFVYVGYGVL